MKKLLFIFALLFALAGGLFLTKPSVQNVQATAVDNCVYTCPIVHFAWDTQEVDVASHYTCPEGYNIDPQHSNKCIQTATRYADYSGNPSNHTCPSSDNSYTSTNSSKPCSRVVTINSIDATLVATTYKTVHHTADVQYEKSQDPTKCHRPSDDTLSDTYGMTSSSTRNDFKNANAEWKDSIKSAPAGFVLGEDGVCRPITVVDVCPNLPDNQATLPAGYHFETNSDEVQICVQDPIVTVTATPTPTQTPSNGGGSNGGGDGLGCATHDCSGNKVGGGSSSTAVLGASTGPTKAVLGASTFAGTGTFENTVMDFMLAAGMIVLSLGGLSYAKEKKN